MRLKKRLEGDRLDLDACINATIDLRIRVPPDPRVHAILGRQQRDLSVLVLLDLSQSTNDMVANAGTTVLNLAREATVLLADAMARIGDSFRHPRFLLQRPPRCRLLPFQGFRPALMANCRRRAWQA